MTSALRHPTTPTPSPAELGCRCTPALPRLGAGRPGAGEREAGDDRAQQRGERGGVDAEGHGVREAGERRRVEHIEVDVHVDAPRAGRLESADDDGRVGEVLDGQHRDPVLVDEALLLVVDRADAAEHESIGRDACVGIECEPVGALARDRPQGHSTEPARWGGLGGVEIGVRVEPQHDEVVGRLLRGVGDGGEGDAAVSADGDRRAGRLRQGLLGAFPDAAERAVPAHPCAELVTGLDRHLDEDGRGGGQVAEHGDGAVGEAHGTRRDRALPHGDDDECCGHASQYDVHE